MLNKYGRVCSTILGKKEIKTTIHGGGIALISNSIKGNFL